MHLNNRILAVDDSADNLLILREILGGHFEVAYASSGEEALRLAPSFQPNLILLDVMMPGIGGIETCRRLREHLATRDTKIVMLSAKSELRDRLAAYRVGAVDYMVKPFDDREVLVKVQTWMSMVHHDQVDGIWKEADRTREALGVALVTMASFRDQETGDHLFRMRWYSQVLAEQLSVSGPYTSQIDETFLAQLYRASPLHDIGKVGIPDSILQKPGVLSHAEFEVMKRHTTIGGDMLLRAVEKLPDADYLKMAAEVARSHHERFNGSGYPDGLAAEQIPLAAQIVAVADVFDAITSRRVYKEARPVEEGAREIRAGSGSLFNPHVVTAFEERFEDFRQGHQRFCDRCPPQSSEQWIGQTTDDAEFGFHRNLACETASILP
jgi:putative two-component system response regulator